MESDLLRVILIILGLLLVLGIYLWDRFKRQGVPRIKMGRRLKEPDFDLPERDDDVGEVKVVGRLGGREAEPFIGAPDRAEPVSEDSFSASRSEPLQDDQMASSARASEQASLHAPLFNDFVAGLELNAHADSDYLNLDPALMDEVPRLIVQINLMSRQQPFSFQQLQQAFAQVDLQFGDMQIYHRQDDAGQVLFSMASGVEPGTFPTESVDFQTPRLTLFTQLPGVRDGLAVYADMLFTAERLASLLDAVLQDERHNKLTKQSIEHTRELILEHRRKIQLLRSKR